VTFVVAVFLPPVTIAPVLIRPVMVVTAVVIPVPTPTIVGVRGVRTGRARHGRAGGPGTTQHSGDCHAERGSKAGNTHIDLLSQQAPRAPAWIGQGNRRPQPCTGWVGAPTKTLNVLE
jgi:hypothetical protein